MKMRKNLGKKRVEFQPEHVQKIVTLFLKFESGPDVKIFDNDDFGYRQITVHQPLIDENGKVVTDRSGKPKSDISLKDTEDIPLKEDVDEYFEREVIPYSPNAWYSPSETKIGYSVSFNKYFYKYSPPRTLSEIALDLEKLEQESETLLEEITE